MNFHNFMQKTQLALLISSETPKKHELGNAEQSLVNYLSEQCTEVGYTSFLFSGFVLNTSDGKLVNLISVQ